ncbi:FAD-dependent pyridine nucleotide-disulphide oxidoreductase [Sulfolobus islandicus Y.G.57.14]|uniref:FAD-dependent pyridine nucleotide-disulphide oxidoreductase n=1 Tax=Saccharolobus islandicus (strain Y.G.57.14 / Yellowstone \|nr:FAD-dependent oxidoreductase [Sulfolobus islandicus]ACP45133.1 FAD-dependent pyridine nucleotide-disulphide oxidoreductase [Sulfolobus islandicus Y.G.57.14]
MEYADCLIIGSGIAGYNALKELLSIKPNAKVIMVSSDRYYPYDRPPLSKQYLRGRIPRDKLFFESEEFYRRDNLKVILDKKVDRINVKEKTAILSDNNVIQFEKALIATGGSPRRLGIAGESLDGVHYLRTLDDADNLKRDIVSSKRALIIGGGFIGVEVASSLTLLGVKTTVVEVKPYIWNTFADEKISKFIQKYFENKGVQFILNESVKEFQGDHRVRLAVTESGKRIEADLVLIAVGIMPNIEVAQKSGIEVGNGIIVNEYLQTNVSDIYAAGDVANIYDPIEKRRKRIEHWNNAEYTGKLAARNMVGGNEPYNFISSIWSDIFDLHIESAGDTMNYDEYVIRGRFELDKPNFNVIYLKGGIVKGYLAINREFEELETLNKMIERGIDISGKKNSLIDESFDLKKLL